MTLFGYVGVIVSLLTFLGVVLVLAYMILEKLQSLWSAFAWAQKRLARHEVGKMVVQEACFFSQYPQAFLCMEALGETLRDSDGYRIADVRDLFAKKLNDYHKNVAGHWESVLGENHGKNSMPGDTWVGVVPEELL